MTKDTRSQTATALRAVRPDIPETVATEKADGWWRHFRTLIVAVVLILAGMLVRDNLVISSILVVGGVFLAVNAGHAMSGETTDALKARGDVFSKVVASAIGGFRRNNSPPNGGYGQ